MASLRRAASLLRTTVLNSWQRSAKPRQFPPWTFSSTKTPNPRTSSPSPLSPAAFLLLGSAAGVVGSAQTCFADGPTASEQGHWSSPAEAEASGVDLEKLVSSERRRLEELLASRGMHRGTYPPFTVAVKGQKVTVKFKIPPACEVSRLIVDIVSHLGLKTEQNSGGSDMILRAWDSCMADNSKSP